MTTRITIKNEETSGHDINVNVAGNDFVIKPGRSLDTHIWAGCDVNIKEIAPEVFVPSERSPGPAGYGRQPTPGTK